MTLSIAYESVQDASMRLSATVVLYDGKPVYIREVTQVGADDPKGDIFRVYAEPLPRTGNVKAEQMRKFISSKKFDMAPFPMGFINEGAYTYYGMRLPRKQQSQGLSEKTFNAVAVGYEGELPPLGFGKAVVSQSFVDCIEGKYPTMDDAVRSINDGKAQSVGISRTYALVKDRELDGLIYLYHKKDKVGFILDGALKLAKTAFCLRESLREVGIKC